MVELDASTIGERLDRAIVAALARSGVVCTRSQLARAFVDQLVSSDGRTLQPGRPQTRVMKVELDLPQPEPLRAEPEPLPLRVVYEDEAVLVVDKPAHMPVHASIGHVRGTLVNAVLAHLNVGASELPVLPGNDAMRPGIVHRIDMDTSGLLVVTKTFTAQTSLARQFREHHIERSYLGIVVGNPNETRFELDTLHGRDPNQRKRFSPMVARGRRARTTVVVEQQLRGACVCRFYLDTGRTHQIRMHAAHIGHPILADALYGARPRDPAICEVALQLGRHALHATTLGFVHPLTGAWIRLDSPLPDELMRAILQLGGNPV